MTGDGLSSECLEQYTTVIKGYGAALHRASLNILSNNYSKRTCKSNHYALGEGRSRTQNCHDLI